MKIVLVAPLFYPDVGGPATHVRKIADFLSQKGHRVVVIAYGENMSDLSIGYQVIRISRSYISPVRWLLYLLHTLKNTFGADLVYTFDLTAAGLPAALSATLLRKPFFIRIGGDPIWERVVEHHKRFVPLNAYYEQGLYKKDAPMLYKLIRWIVGRADRTITYSQPFQDFYCQYFGVDRARMSIIKNPAFSRERVAHADLPDQPTVLFAGRFVSYKNLEMVIRAIKKINMVRPVYLLLVGKGPDEMVLRDLVRTLDISDRVEFKPSVAQSELFELIKQSAVSIGPAISEFNPNFILESLSLGTPVLLAQDNGLSVTVPLTMTFDPLNQKDFEDKILALLTGEGYRRAVADVSRIDLNWSWEQVLAEHEKLVIEYTTSHL
jgi:glycosyltransferase involved in cell wall biosynthesis